MFPLFYRSLNGDEKRREEMKILDQGHVIRRKSMSFCSHRHFKHSFDAVEVFLSLKLHGQIR